MKNVLYAFAIVATVAACDSPEQKAAKYYAQAQELVVQGDNQRALVELRNALKNDPTRRDARLLFAQLLEQAGRHADAYGQYLDVLERNPGDPDASRELTLIAIEALEWDEAAKYLQSALAGNPDDRALGAVKIALDYRTSALANNPVGMQNAARAARELMQTDPSLTRARLVVLSDLLRTEDYEAVLSVVDDGLATAPDDYEMNKIKLVALQRMDRTSDFEAHLLKFIGLYPDDRDVNRTLVQLYLQTGRIDMAEARLREQIDPQSEDPAARMALLGFLAQVRSIDAMRAEFDVMLAQDPLAPDVAANIFKFRTLRAQATFAAGQRDVAQNDLVALIDGAEPSAEVDTIKIHLAHMRRTVGNLDGAKTLVEEVLARDPGQVEALKTKADWLIEEGHMDQALGLLRDALANSPNDPTIFTLMATIYQRTGKTDLIPEMLARAAEVSGYAPRETITYANYLTRMKQYVAAQGVLVNARNADFNNFEVVSSLARIHLLMKNWPLVHQDITILERQFDTDDSRALQNELRAQLLQGQGKSDQLADFLSDLARSSGDAVGPQIGIIRNMIASGDLEGAFQQATDLSNANPDVLAPKMLIAQILLAQEKTDDAVRHLRGITAEMPDAVAAWQLLQTVQLRAGDMAGALQTIDAGLQNLPEHAGLLKSKAIVLEKTGDTDAAIDIYEELYAADPNDLLSINNLASLLVTTRDDDASLDRAWAISRRLNDNPLPAFNDTVGWISFRRGDLDKALVHLENAAKGLPSDPSVAYHLGRVYAAMGRNDAADAEYARARGLLDASPDAFPGLADDLAQAQGR